MNGWMIICNTQKFDIIKHFENEKTLVWKQPKNVKVGDIVAIYLSAPYSSIKYICKVNEVDIKDTNRILQFYKDRATNVKETDMYMEIEMMRDFENSELIRKKLLTYNLTCFQRPTKIPEKLLQHILLMLGER